MTALENAADSIRRNAPNLKAAAAVRDRHIRRGAEKAAAELDAERRELFYDAASLVTLVKRECALLRGYTTRSTQLAEAFVGNFPE